MPTIEISKETYDKIKDQLTQAERVELNQYEDMVGGKYFFRTVTYHLLGRVKSVCFGNWLELEDASWIADAGRFADFLKTGTANESEQVGKCYVNMDTVTDFFPWKNELIREQI